MTVLAQLAPPSTTTTVAPTTTTAPPTTTTTTAPATTTTAPATTAPPTTEARAPTTTERATTTTSTSTTTSIAPDPVGAADGDGGDGGTIFLVGAILVVLAAIGVVAYQLWRARADGYP
jgi:hypothetical protein